MWRSSQALYCAKSPNLEKAALSKWTRARQESCGSTSQDVLYALTCGSPAPAPCSAAAAPLPERPCPAAAAHAPPGAAAPPGSPAQR